MNEQQWQALNARLAGIELPPTPDWWPLIWTAAALVVVLAILGLVMRRRRLSATNQPPAAAAARRLKDLQQAWQAGELAPRETAYQLATLLRLGLELKQLEPTPPPRLAGQQAQWQATLTTLARLRYQAQGDTELSERTFVQIREWLQC